MGGGTTQQCKSLKKFKIDLENPSSWIGRINSVALAVASKATRRCKQPLSRFQSNPFLMRITKACPIAGTEVYQFTIWVLDPLFLGFSLTLCLLNPLHLPPSDLFPSHLFPILKQKAPPPVA